MNYLEEERKEKEREKFLKSIEEFHKKEKEEFIDKCKKYIIEVAVDRVFWLKLVKFRCNSWIYGNSFYIESFWNYNNELYFLQVEKNYEEKGKKENVK